MPLVLKKSISIFILTAIITPIVVATILGLGGIVISKSESVTKVVAVSELMLKNFESIAIDIRDLKTSVADISTSSMDNHLIVLKTVMNNEQEDNIYRAKVSATLEIFEDKLNHNKNQITYLKGRLKGR